MGLPQEVLDELQRREFSSIVELQKATDELMARRNRAALADFEGRSPDQMSWLLYRPFESPQLVRFAGRLEHEPHAPILELFLRLAEAMGEKGLKATAELGNLPRGFCREVAAQAAQIARPEPWLEPQKLRSETDYPDLHVTRLVAGLAGLVRKYKGRFVLTRKARTLLEGGGGREIYPLLFEAHARKFNWAYRDRYPEAHIVQQAFGFTLYLLDRHGGDWKPASFYEDAFLRAFPRALAEMPETDWSTPERRLRHCYRLRTLERFADFLGLADLEAVGHDSLDQDFRVRRRPLLRDLVMFRVAAGAAPGTGTA